MAGIGPVDGHVHDGAGLVAFHTGNAEFRHQFGVSCGDLPAVDLNDHAAAADFFHFADPGKIRRRFAGIADADGDGVGGRRFGKGREFKELFLGQGTVVHRGNFELPHGQGAGFVKDDGTRLRKLLQPDGSFHQDAGFSRAADAGEEGQRDADDQRAGTADDQESQGPVDPVAPFRGKPQEQAADHGRQHRQRQGAEDNRRRIDPGKAGNEIFGPGLQGRGVFHQLQDL